MQRLARLISVPRIGLVLGIFCSLIGIAGQLAAQERYDGQTIDDHVSSIDGAKDPERQMPSYRFKARLGIQSFTDFRTTFRVDSDLLGIGTELSLEQDLALEQRINVVRTEFELRLSRRHGIAVSHYDASRKGSRDLSTEIRIGEEVYEIGAAVKTEFDEEIFKLAYLFQFVERPKASLDGVAGLHVTRFRSSMSTLDSSQASLHVADAPLPVLGLSGTYRFAPRWRLIGTAEFFDVQAGDLRGDLRDMRAAVEHDTFANAGFGIGLNRVVLDFDIHENDLSGLVALKFNSGIVYFFGRFGDRP